jgi:hypothetical protein
MHITFQIDSYMFYVPWFPQQGVSDQAGLPAGMPKKAGCKSFCIRKNP